MFIIVQPSTQSNFRTFASQNKILNPSAVTPFSRPLTTAPPHRELSEVSTKEEFKKHNSYHQHDFFKIERSQKIIEKILGICFYFGLNFQPNHEIFVK